MADELETILEFSEDISTAEAPLPLPIGEYEAEIIQAGVKVSQMGNRYCEIHFHVPVDAFPVDFSQDEAPDGVRLVYRRLGAEDDKRSRARLRKFCEAIGANTGTSLDLNEWVGLTGRIVVGHSEYEGEDRAEVLRIESND